jgi:hypothetical protein
LEPSCGDILKSKTLTSKAQLMSSAIPWPQLGSMLIWMYAISKAILGHESIHSNQICTKVALDKLKRVHTEKHPAHLRGE